MFTSTSLREDTVSLKWLEEPPPINLGCTFGVPWPRGFHTASETYFTCSTHQGYAVPVQSRAIAYWPDGSIKWTSHSLLAGEVAVDGYVIRAVASREARQPDVPEDATKRVTVRSSPDSIEVNTGKIRVFFATSGPFIVQRLESAKGFVRGVNGHLILLSQDGLSDTDLVSDKQSPQTFHSQVESVVVEQAGPVRGTVLVRGRHTPQHPSTGKSWLPFTLRFYLYANSDAVKVVHTLTYDGDPESSFIRGIGLRFNVPLREAKLYDRHVRIAGVEGGVLNEAVQGVTGLWRDPGVSVKAAQREGRILPDEHTWNADVPRLLKWVPTWNDYNLLQLSPDGFTLKKRTKAGHSWVNIPGGTRADGLAYLGTAQNGGLAIGMRHFWERYPTSLAVQNAVEDVGQITLWLYSPAAEPLDLRSYHDGLGQKTYEDQLDALKITYEDWEPGLGSPFGVARTNEIFIFALGKTPTSAHTANLTKYMRNPPVLVTSTEYIWETEALGKYWSPLAKLNLSPVERKIESRLEFLFDFYRQQVEERRWYGFWDHGDIMHTYDNDRHTWRYDIGGYAWDNSELSPDLWLWLYFLRTGRGDVFRMAEALTRHTGEVDVYHLGPLKGLGTRHGVQHWSDSCKQARISNPLYRRVFFFLTGGDERTGELMEETLRTTETFQTLDPYRKVRKDQATYKPNPNALELSLGTDWSAIASSWYIEWERRGPGWELAKDKLTASMRGIADLRNGFVTGPVLFDPESGDIKPPASDAANAGVVRVSHLSAMFGLAEICAELIATLKDAPLVKFNQAWFEYCRYFNATVEEQTERFDKGWGEMQLRQGHSRLTAYAAATLGNVVLARRAWKEFFEYSDDGYGDELGWTSDAISGSQGLVAVTEAPWVSTNVTALYGLAAIQNLALVRGYLGDEAVKS